MEEFVFEEEAVIEATFQMDVANGNHPDLDGRDLPDQHPISAITGLETALSGKQDTISDLSTIRSNAEHGESAYDTIQEYGDIVTHNVSEFATASQGEKADTALQPNDNISELVNNAGYISGITSSDVTNALGYTPYNSSNPSGYQANVIETIKVNGTSQTVTNKAVDITVPTTAADVGALPDTTTINDLTTTAQQNALNSGATSANIGQIATNTSDISTINEKIPAQASSSNQLADKNFVNSSISTNTANFIGTFNSVAELEAYSGTLTNNDYAFVVTTDSQGNTVYDRYKYTTATTPASWQFEYELNNSSFTADQWAAINSGATTTNIGQIATNTSDISDLQTNKQDTLTAGSGIDITSNTVTNTGVRSVSTGATNGTISVNTNGTSAEVAVYGLGNAAYTASTDYDASGAASTAETNAKNYADGLASNYATAAQGALADTALQPADLNGYATETWVGNQGYQTTANLVTSISSLSTDTEYASAKCMYDLIGDVETLLSQV